MTGASSAGSTCGSAEWMVSTISVGSVDATGTPSQAVAWYDLTDDPSFAPAA